WRIPMLFNKQRYVSFFLMAFLSTCLSSFLRAGVAYYISTSMSNAPIDFQHLCINSFLNISVWTIGLTSIKLLFDRRREAKRLEETEKERVASELNFLKAQHNPHFLFNSLNTLYFQIDKTNEDARSTLMKL